ncbi:hypothetical protein [Micromonospora sp. DT229]|uniref:hypothetical protein n=1 Tax=Micromonospora sp. DT229 TaxID=3393430 RepID=UPI003CFBB12D
MADALFEEAPAVRSFPSYRGQGLYWAACIGDHVGFESWLEREEAMALDFDASVGGLRRAAVLVVVAGHEASEVACEPQPGMQ